MKELNLQNLIRAELSKQGIMNFRNNTGMGWAGKAIKINTNRTIAVHAGDVVVCDARPLHAGLCEGSSDIVGIKSVVITADMVGQTIGMFYAREVKTPTGRVSSKQQVFIDNVNEAGGDADIIRDPSEV